MEKQMKVLFRWWKDDVIAIFPSQRDWPNPTLCVGHISRLDSMGRVILQ